MSGRVSYALSIVLLVLGAAFLARADDVGFDSDEGETEFAAGKEDFEIELYKAAEKHFKACKKFTKSKEDKDALERWLDACKGGSDLKKLNETLIRKKKWKSAWKKLLKLDAKYSDTPLYEQLQKTRARVGDELYLRVADYEEKPLDPERGRDGEWTSKNEDPRFVRHGRGSLKWNARYPKQWYVTVGHVADRALTGCSTFEAWIYSPGNCEVAVCFHADADNTLSMSTTGAIAGNNLHGITKLEKPGWHPIRLDLKQLSKVGDVRIHQCRLITLCLTSTRVEGELYVDEVMLGRRKD